VDSADHTTLVGYYTTYARYGSWTYYAWFANKYSSNGSSIWGSTYGSQPLQYNYPVDYAYAVTTGSSVVGGSVNNNGYTVGAVNSPYIVEFYDGHYVKPAPTYGFLNIGGSGTIGEQNLRITLKPGQGAFEIQTITINPVIGNYYPIGPLYGYGTKNYLNIIWNATYGNTLVGKISAACYLNCPLTITDISQCISPSIQSCQYTGAAGIGSCTITNPTYDYKNKNTVICSFRNPDNPSMTYKPYPNGTFMPISFSLRLPSVITFPIGTMNRLPFNILNLGLLEDSYNTLVASTNPSFFNSVDNPSSTSRALYNEQASAFPRLQFMSSSIPYTLTVQISSAADPSTCTVASDCSSLVYGSTPACVQGRCNYQVQIPVQATLASLPDFDWTGVVQILILSTVVLLVVSRKIKVFK
jgi:hypothetical protein